MPVNLPDKVRELLKILRQGGYEAYTVGGCVRDSLLDITPHDWDICTSATPEQMKRCFEGLRVIETGIQHGTITVMLDAEPFEVTTFRIDGEYRDNRHPTEVVFVHNLSEDLSRRDFTINAMAYNDELGLADPFGGEADLMARQIRCVGDPDKRFNEDALRILRALRFAAVFGFDIEPLTAESIHKNKELLRHIAAERIQTELNRLLCGQGAASVLREYADVAAVFIPEIVPMIGFDQANPHHIFDVWEHTLQSLTHAPKTLAVRLTLLLHDIAKPVCFSKDENGKGHFYGHPVHSAVMAETILKRLRYDNLTTETVKDLVFYHDIEIKLSAGHTKKLLNKLGPENLLLLLSVKQADYSAQNPDDFHQRLLKLNEFRVLLDKVLSEAQCFTLKDLAVSGSDLIDIGIPQGTGIGEILKALLELVINDTLENRKDALLEAARKMR